MLELVNFIRLYSGQMLEDLVTAYLLYITGQSDKQALQQVTNLAVGDLILRQDNTYAIVLTIDKEIYILEQKLDKLVCTDYEKTNFDRYYRIKQEYTLDDSFRIT